MSTDGRPDERLQDTLRRRILLSLGVAVLVYLGFLVWSDWRGFAAALGTFPVALLLPVLALAFANYVLRFLKFARYLQALGVTVATGRSFRIFLAGLAGTVTPGKLGEVLKSFFLRRDAGAPVSLTAPIVLAERFTDLVALLALTALGLGDTEGGRVTALTGLGLCLALLAVVACRGPVTALLRRLASRGGRLGVLGQRLDTAYESTRTLLAPRLLLMPTLVSVGAWFCECLGFYLVLRGLGAEVSLERAVFIYCLSTLVGALVMLPGGIGPTEGSMTALLMGLNVPRAAAVAATLVIRACTLWFAVAVGALALATLHPDDDGSRRMGVTAGTPSTDH